MLTCLGRRSRNRACTPKPSPPFRRRWTGLPLVGRSRLAHNADRFWNRYRNYPKSLPSLTAGFDLFHIVDHSYAHLVHWLPADQTGVYCHDLDAFRCLLEPQAEPRPPWFRALVQQVLSGMQRAAVVFFNSQYVGKQIEQFDLVDPARLIHAPLGVAPEFTPATSPDTLSPFPLALRTVLIARRFLYSA